MNLYKSQSKEPWNPKEPARGHRRPERGHLGHGGEWKETEGNHTHSAIHLPIQQKTQKRGLEGYGSSSSAPPTCERTLPIELGQQEVQPSIPLRRALNRFLEDMSQRATLQRSYGNHQRIKLSQGLLWKQEGLALRNQELTWRAPKGDKKYYGIYFLSRK
ncbi:hypothetical protein O181_047872 [Austropuccinia psidii MF-1]|uniref:Uncharacterized protein n=1 Tax=Austropuccinia psidii MF-1 TaxID=1389203 RepID=A0A9Q3DYP7_9BASI|nr:hypothetical protein [Austropuccinia psidii MF-1]